MTADDASAEQELQLVEAKAAAVCSHPALPEDFKPLCLRKDAGAALARLGKVHESFIRSFLKTLSTYSKRPPSSGPISMCIFSERERDWSAGSVSVNCAGCLPLFLFLSVCFQPVRSSDCSFSNVTATGQMFSVDIHELEHFCFSALVATNSDACEICESVACIGCWDLHRGAAFTEWFLI